MPNCRVGVIRSSLCNVSFSDRSLHFFTDPNVLFLVDSLIYGKEDSDILLVCPLTDPDVSNFTLRKCDGKRLPKNMTFIPNPQKGITIKNVQRSFKGCYQCLAKHNGVEKISEHIFLNVRPGNTGFLLSCRAPDFTLHLPGTGGKCCEASPCVLTLSWGGWRWRSPLEAFGVFYSKPEVLAHQAIALGCPWPLQVVQRKVVDLENLFWASCVRAQVDLVALGLWLCWAGLAMITFIFCSWWFPGVFFTISRNVGCAVKLWGQTSAMRFEQVCAGKVEIWMPYLHVCCLQVTAGETDWWH